MLFYSKAIKVTVMAAGLLFAATRSHAQLMQTIKDQVKQTADQRATDKATKTTNNTIDKGDTVANGGVNKLKGMFKKKKKTDSTATATPATTNGIATTSDATASGTAATGGANGAPAFTTAYQNYDFVPGNKILFEDNFEDDQDGEFPAHWELIAGQAVVNKIAGVNSFLLTDGNYVRVNPRMKTTTYLTDSFTIEYDYYFVPGAYGIITMLDQKPINKLEVIMKGEYS